MAERFTQLSKSVYFDPAFRDFSHRTAGAICHVLSHFDDYPEELVRQFEKQVWRVMQFVRGSRSNDAPHETQFVLRTALRHWIDEEALVSSAALEDFNFFLNTEDVWDFINRSLNHFDSEDYKPLVVRIGSPEVYKHRPVFCIPLFHELGHFVDHYFEISKTSFFLAPPAAPPQGISRDNWNFINLRHRMEHFADIFSACHCGEASYKSLLAIAPNNQDSPTHPATSKRVEVVSDFLSSTPNTMVALLQKACSIRTGKELEARFSNPNIEASFDDVLTYEIKDDSELFGIFLAGWEYLDTQINDRTASWIDGNITISGIEKTVNDLVEKSIRNYEIKERWVHGTSD
ncbi:hypothetical protein [uncultured Roseovarius sp.]|uniref:hypothetical protein n=1 Tax=uncultured Roseovarius sp. TaxID=293344 RepID=UPI00259A9690|nr:hypothetical protein [uncultured Roseovarius sp.]